MRLTWAHKLSPQLTASTPHAVNSTLTGQKVENCGHYLLGIYVFDGVVHIFVSCIRLETFSCTVNKIVGYQC